MASAKTAPSGREQDGDDQPQHLSTWNDEKFYDVSYGVNRSRRYHAKMRSWYQGWHDLVMALNAVLGAGAFVALISGKNGLFPQILTGFVAAGSAVDTVLGLSRKARQHDELSRRFTDLAARMISREANTANYMWACAERLKIEKDELPVRRIVDLIADNEEARSRGVSENQLLPLSAWQRRFGYFFTFGMSHLEKRLARQQAHIDTST